MCMAVHNHAGLTTYAGIYSYISIYIAMAIYCADNRPMHVHAYSICVGPLSIAIAIFTHTLPASNSLCAQEQ